MAKLYFRYGTVGSAKSMNLLAVAHNYRFQNKVVVLIKPKLDTRFGAEVIKSRSGLNMEADILVDEDTIIDPEQLAGVHCILVDEAQFLSASVVDQLRAISRDLEVPVICYGLRTDFRTEMFVGAKRLMETADALEEIKTTCTFCNKKAIFNLKVSNGAPSVTGAQIDLGAEEKYLPACAGCYAEQLKLERADETDQELDIIH